MAAAPRRRRRPRGGRGRPRHPSSLHRQLAARSAPPGRQHRHQRRADRPSPVRRPLTTTAQALCAGELSAAHTSVLAHGTHDPPDHVAAEAEPVLVAAARRLDPPRLRRVLGHLHLVADPDGASSQAERRHGRHGLWLAPPGRAWSPPTACWSQRPARSCWPPGALARPHNANDPRSSDQRRADALTELARRALEGGQLPQTGGVRPQLTVVVDVDSLPGRPGAVGGELGWAGPLDPEACRRLACDGALTRVLVSRHQTGHQHAGHRHDEHPDDYQPGDQHPGQIPNHGSGAQARPVAWEPSEDGGLAGRLRMAMALLPPILGGAPSQPLEVGRASRVSTPAQHSALAVRDRGWVVPDCDRPLAWCEGHHLVPWLEGGPTDLVNLALLCRAHHRAVHEGGWRLTRGPDGRFTATGPHRQPPPHRRQPAAA